MAFVKSGLQNMLFWKSLIKFKLIWIVRCTPAEYSFIYKPCKRNFSVTFMLIDFKELRFLLFLLKKKLI